MQQEAARGLLCPSPSDILAVSQAIPNEGEDRCHWCGSACKRQWLHDDVAPLPFFRSRSTAKNPSGAYICNGCWIYRRKRVSVSFLGGDYEDRKTLSEFSWILTRQGIWVLKPQDRHLLYKTLLNPPKVFCLSLLSAPKTENMLQLSVSSCQEEIRGDTPLSFTVDNSRFVYTVYDLEVCLKGHSSGVTPGARELVRLFGECPEAVGISKEETKKKPGVSIPLDAVSKGVGRIVRKGHGQGQGHGEKEAS